MRRGCRRGHGCGFFAHPSLCPAFEPDPHPAWFFGKNFKSVLQVGLTDNPVSDPGSLPKVNVDPCDLSSRAGKRRRLERRGRKQRRPPLFLKRALRRGDGLFCLWSGEGLPEIPSQFGIKVAQIWRGEATPCCLYADMNDQGRTFLHNFDGSRIAFLLLCFKEHLSADRPRSGVG